MALSEPSIDDVIAHIEHVISIVGEDYIALGSDRDGWLRPAVDAASLPHLTEAMPARG